MKQMKQFNEIKRNVVNFLFRNEDECAHFYNENEQRATRF